MKLFISHIRSVRELSLTYLPKIQFGYAIVLWVSFLSFIFEIGFSQSEPFTEALHAIQFFWFSGSIVYSLYRVLAHKLSLWVVVKILLYSLVYGLYSVYSLPVLQYYVQTFLVLEILLRLASNSWWRDGEWTSARIIFVLFFGLIIIGASMLMLPAFHAQNSLSWIDSIFLSTSALCVTGLSTVDIGTVLSEKGQWLLMSLFQIGGLGPITFIAFISYFSRHQKSINGSLLLEEAYSMENQKSVRHLVFTIIGFSLLVEAVGVLALMVINNGNHSFFWLLFHSVSAFCNAGFGLEADSFASIMNMPGHLYIFGILIFVGGLGFPVWMDVFSSIVLYFKNAFGENKRRFKIRLYSKICIKLHLLLLVTASILFFVLEYQGLLAKLSYKDSIANVLFYAATLRTAGFSAFDVSALSSAGVVLSMVLMVIGAGAVSTGGGLKFSTIYLAWKTMVSYLRGYQTVMIRYRSVPSKTIRIVISIFILYFFVLFSSVFLLALIEPTLAFRDVFFECISALSTVGLSMGITSDFSTAGKVVLIFTMLAGRMGPLVLISAFLQNHSKTKPYSYPEEKFIIG
jgi:trk system potassium uptake protein